MTRYRRTTPPLLSPSRRFILMVYLLLTYQVPSIAAQAFLTCASPTSQAPPAKPGVSTESSNFRATGSSKSHIDPLTSALSLIAHAESNRATADILRRIRVVDAPIPNAYSSPSGEVLITNSLLRAMTDPAQLSFVIAHEIGHAFDMVTRENSSLEAELAADVFANAVLTRAGITGCAGIAALTTLATEHASSLPSLTPRLRALRANAPTCIASVNTFPFTGGL